MPGRRNAPWRCFRRAGTLCGRDWLRTESGANARKPRSDEKSGKVSLGALRERVGRRLLKK